ncbi:hypothetical protein K469DRAFT_732234 [Zopfia rhizophila CBS 207.26]|uniref:Uncharacterized protein n=1 Tax=Zopfia rhizophila CBS 207.26 TaxID=1314779 RepID=A0A6A6DHD8_9PEZI|nr:hypothetical protein K469DRAFT_732234 [Zopfia rhizophila CBS 207.26]
MSISSASTNVHANLRKPPESQRNIGGDMSMFFIARLPLPRRFASPERQQIKGLNFETIITVHFPLPAWLNEPEYAALQPQTNDDNAYSALFSLNLSIYDQTIVPSDWDDMYFFPYDLCYQPLAPRMFNVVNSFPTVSPIVTFTGLIVGSGLILLHNDPVSGLSETQQKCCGFVQLLTFITPGNLIKPPFRGLHQFQVFVIFPIHVNPWMTRCKKMAERQNTQFQPNITFNCTGRIAGFLSHHIMVHPPQLPQDYVCIVVPDSWAFLEKSSRDSLSTSPSTTTSARRSSSDPRSKFMSPAKRKPDQLSDPVTLKTSSDNGAPMTTPSSQTPDTSYTGDMSTIHISPPLKRPRTDYILQPSVNRDPSASIALDDSSNTDTPTHTTNLLRTNDGKKSQPSKPINTPATNLVPYSIPQAPVLSADDTNRPHRNRQPTKKSLKHRLVQYNSLDINYILN